MHIRYGDTGYIVDYIQAFLKENFGDSVVVSGVYDKSTHNNLVKYLELPEVADSNTVFNILISRFEIENYFFIERYVDNIVFESFEENSDTVNFMANIYNELKQIVYDSGWKIIEYTNYRNLNTGKYRIKIAKSRENKIPNSELISMVNKFDGTYYYDFYLDPYNNQIVYQVACGYKLAMIPCYPNTKYTIAHGYSDLIQVRICSYNEYSISNMKNIEKCEEVYISKTGNYIYETSNNARYILVQVPYITLATTNYNARLILGDVNLDNKLDSKDIELMSDCLSGKARVDNHFFEVYDVDKNGVFNSDDLTELINLVDNRDITYINKNVPLTEESVGITLLVVQFSDIEEYKIPIDTYNEELWMIHDKLIGYILGINISKYSRPNDISYLHRLVRAVIPSSRNLGQSGEYTEELKGYVRELQFKNDISYAFGYLDTETEKLMLEGDNNAK